MMAIAINETMHTPPTREPAIRDSCCPSSDLYSSGDINTHDTHTLINSRSYCDGDDNSYIHTAEHLGEVKHAPDSFLSPHRT